MESRSRSDARRYPWNGARRKVLLAEPRGFCAGVEMAIKALAWMVRLFPAPVYCYHEIVHNRLDRGAVRGPRRDLRGRHRRRPRRHVPLMLSAHGSAPEIVAAAQANDRFVVNAVCPLVTKVHHEARVRAEKGYTILYVGHAGHDEAVGTLAVAPEAIRLVEHDEDLDGALRAVDDPDKVALLAQTTLALHDWEGIADEARGRFPELWTATRNDLCFATTNRQERALRDRGPGRRGRRDRERELVEHDRAGEGGDRRRLPDRAARSTGPTSSTSRRSATPRSSGSPPARARRRTVVQAVIAALAPDRGRRARPRHRRGRVLPAATRAARPDPQRRPHDLRGRGAGRARPHVGPVRRGLRLSHPRHPCCPSPPPPSGCSSTSSPRRCGSAVS